MRKRLSSAMQHEKRAFFTSDILEMVQTRQKKKNICRGNDANLKPKPPFFSLFVRSDEELNFHFLAFSSTSFAQLAGQQVFFPVSQRRLRELSMHGFKSLSRM